MPIQIPTSTYTSVEDRAELAARLIEDTHGLGNQELIESSLRQLLKKDANVHEVPNTIPTLVHAK